jgi:hypothetical protein
MKKTSKKPTNISRPRPPDDFEAELAKQQGRKAVGREDLFA